MLFAILESMRNVTLLRGQLVSLEYSFKCFKSTMSMYRHINYPPHPQWNSGYKAKYLEVHRLQNISTMCL